jgi:hypothetical protein
MRLGYKDNNWTSTDLDRYLKGNYFLVLKLHLKIIYIQNNLKLGL